MVPSAKKPALSKILHVKACSTSKYSLACSVCCQGFYLSDFCVLGWLKFILVFPLEVWIDMCCVFTSDVVIHIFCPDLAFSDGWALNVKISHSLIVPSFLFLCFLPCFLLSLIILCAWFFWRLIFCCCMAWWQVGMWWWSVCLPSTTRRCSWSWITSLMPSCPPPCCLGALTCHLTHAMLSPSTTWPARCLWRVSTMKVRFYWLSLPLLI